MISWLIYIIVFLILCFVLLSGTKALSRGIQAKNSNKSSVKNKVLNNTNKIYRCYYNYESKEFEPLELRTDKKYPNPRNIVKQITEYHKNPFTYQQYKQ